MNQDKFLVSLRLAPNQDKSYQILSDTQILIKNKLFTFDHIFDTSSPQSFVFNTISKYLLDQVLQGFNSTIMAYGQTGSGKTYTIFGNQDGITYHALEYLFNQIQTQINQRQFLITLSLMQIYNENIYDLIETDNQSLPIREDPNTGVFVHGLTQVAVQSLEEALSYVKLANRITKSTKLNNQSSRSHAILQILVQQRWIDPQKVVSPLSKQYYQKHELRGLITIVDLAGSERLSKSGSEKLTKQEAISINKSIAALGNCISALSQKKPHQINNYPQVHIPYRDSKLTRLLSESICGNAKTSIILCINPDHPEETYSSLLFGQRAMQICVNAIKNEELYYKVVDKQMEEILQQKRIRQEIDEFEDERESEMLVQGSQEEQEQNDQQFQEQRESELISKYQQIIEYLQQKLIKKVRG